MSLVGPLRRRRSKLTALRGALGDAALVGVYSRDGVRLETLGTVACVDDARCATTSGRLVIPKTGTGGVDIGAQDATFGGLAKLTILVQLTPQDLSIIRTFAARRISTGNAADPWEFRHDASGNLQAGYYNGTVFTLAGPGPALTAGTDTVCAFVFDGTNGTVANRLLLALTKSTGPGVYPAIGGFVALGGTTAPATLSSAATTTSIGCVADAGRPGGAPFDTVAFYIGQALTGPQIDAEIANGFVGAHHRYTFNGSLADTGTVGGWNGSQLGTSLAYCSDDLRWGNILMGSGGGANPTWDAGARELVFDGTSQYLRSVGGLLPTIGTTHRGFAWIGQLPAITAAEQRLLELGDAAGGGNTAGALHEVATSGFLGAGVAGFTFADGSVAASALSGVRVLHGRINDAGGGNLSEGSSVGTASEVTQTIVATLNAPQTLVLNAARAATNFAGGRLRGLVLYKGDYAGKQQLVNQWAASLGAQL